MNVKNIRIIKHVIKSLYNYNRGIKCLTNYPTYFYIEPTNVCNLKCIMCPTGRGLTNIQKGFMGYELYEKIIDEIRPFASTILLSVGGEPLLHPRFTDMVKYASKNGIRTMINTNAVLLDRDMSHEILKSGIDIISFAFDGYTKEKYEKARVGADFEKTVENILEFIKLKKQLGMKKPNCTLSMLMLEKEDEGDKKKRREFFRKFEGLMDNIRLREAHSWGANFKKNDKFIYKKCDGVFNPCGRIWSMFCIKWNGNVVPCACNFNDEYVLGNVNEQSIKSLWNCRKMVELREKMLERTHLEISPICDNCAITGARKIAGVPAGIRMTLSDAINNYIGITLENKLLEIIDIVHGRKI